MEYIKAMNLLSQFHIGAVLISDDDIILDENEAASAMLGAGEKLRGKSLSSVAPGLSEECTEENCYYNVGFMNYIERCTTPEDLELPGNTRMICFQDATSKVSEQMLKTVVDVIPEPIVLADEKKRIIRINNATMRMEGLMQEDVEGRDINEVYPSPISVHKMGTEEELTVPIVLRERRPVLGVRQSYQTYTGKKLEIMCDSYPVLQGKRLLGVFCVTADMAWLEAMSQQYAKRQTKLGDKGGGGKPSKNGKKSELSAKYRFRDIVYQSYAMKDMLEKCKMCAKSDSPVMIYGETGTGKELVAQSIHNESSRANKPFVAINCAAIPENLLESMLFGTEKGAFTGAESRMGLFEQANGGTLLLDELNSMSLALQAKLLRVLQEGVVRRLGGMDEKRIDVRVISNVNIPPREAVEEGKMREDLYYRLGVVSITVPPLRDRKKDIFMLAHTFIVSLNKTLRKSVTGLSDGALSVFYQYGWPGNVRELQHAVEHAMNIIPADGSEIQISHLPDGIREKSGVKEDTLELGKQGGSLEDLLKSIEYDVLTNALIRNNGNISRTAADVGVSRQNLQHRIKRNGIDLTELLSGRSE